MGVYFTDKFSLLHFAMGIVVYYWNISFIKWFLIHLIFELTENREKIVKYIDKIPLWPGGKKKPDTIINSIGDQFYSMLGWLFTHIYLEKIYGGYI